MNAYRQPEQLASETSNESLNVAHSRRERTARLHLASQRNTESGRTGEERQCTADRQRDIAAAACKVIPPIHCLKQRPSDMRSQREKN